jgi:AcrR family transcriptional regulator
MVSLDPKESAVSPAPTTATDRADSIARTRAVEAVIVHPSSILTDCSVYERASVRHKHGAGAHDGGPMTEREHGDAVADVRRDQMLAAASTLIAERGFHDTRIADVAKRVGASPALVIYYFGTKDSLLTEALRWSERSFYIATEEMLKSTDKLRDRLEILVEWTLVADKQDELTGDWGLWFDLWAQAFRHPEVKKDRAELDAQWRALIARIVQDAVDSGEISEVDVESFAIRWGSLLDGLVVQVALPAPVVVLPRARKVALDVAYKELALDGVRPHAKARRGAKGS